MDLDWQVCSRARLSRDARFDGKFFIAVLTSKVYCRSICPAPTAKEKNVRYYPSAAAAAAAGFRPCLRCRPECSPGTPAWLGTPGTVARALRLIAQSGLSDGVEGLAQHLGIGSRHLSRLFLRHLGATPSAVAHTRRLDFAKKLIDETCLPMSAVAVAAGFGCVRRFNAAIRQVYHRTPTQIRRLSRPAGAAPRNEYFFRLRFRPPYNWKGMLAFLAPRATPGVEIVDADSYRRAMSMDGHIGWLEVTMDGGHESLAVRVQFPDPCALYAIIERVRAMFDLNADWGAIAQGLTADGALSARLAANPGMRVPGCWDPFELAIRAILGQQITVKGATMLAGRLARSLGQPVRAPGGITHLFPTPEALSRGDLAGVGLTGARAETIRALARAVCACRIVFGGSSDSADVLARLREIPGIGEWTAQYVAMRALGEPDAFPSGDVGLLRALGLSSARELEQRAEAWRPWRAYASIYLWTTKVEEERLSVAGRV